MTNQFMRAEEVAKELGISKSFAYKLIRQLNQELREQGFLTISGRINRDYFQERLYKTQKGVKLTSTQSSTVDVTLGIYLKYNFT